jgi:ABC-type transporter Mla maintaining outer membrane lipid asymmetry ATPase subunit MlaF
MKVSEEKTQQEDAAARRPIIQAVQLTVRFAGQYVLRDVTLKIPRGQTLAIIGESGCGKTVLMKTIVGLVKPTSGHVFYDNVDINTLSAAELTVLRKKIGFVFQNAALFDSMTIGQNIAFPLHQHEQISPREERDRVYDLLSEVGLPEEVIHKRPAELSGGMRKRIDPSQSAALSGHQRDYYSRYADRAQSCRPGGHAVPKAALRRECFADSLRWSPQPVGFRGRPPSAAVCSWRGR